MNTLTKMNPEPEQQQLAVVPAETQQQAVSLFRTDDPAQVVVRATGVANALKAVMKDRGLISDIKGKEYPKCEAWTLCGTMLGVFPVLSWTRPMEDGWEARVEATMANGTVVGAAEAQCLRSERNWSDRDDFAIRSMAQTRATAKALRMPLGFIMTLAGYEATPSEEMEGAGKQNSTGNQQTTTRTQQKATGTQQKGTATTQQVTGTATKATEAARNWMCKALGDLPALEYFISKGLLKEGQPLTELPLSNVPTSRPELQALRKTIETFSASQGDPGDPPGVEGESNGAGWRTFLMPFGDFKGRPLEDVSKEASKYFFGLAMNYQPKTEYNGKPLSQERRQADEAFRAVLDEACEELGFNREEQ